MLKYFSMFTGVGGFELGIKQAFEKYNKPNPECIGFSEIDKFCNKLLEVKFPNVKNYGDATKINSNELPNFDILVAGFPCQSFSIAGKRKGFDDTRGTLFFDIARILADKRPRYFLLENVKGLLSNDNGKTFQKILRILTSLGYELEWQVLNSKDFGVPQNRERVFIIGYLGEKPRSKVFPIGEGNGTDNEKRILTYTLNSSDWREANRNQKQTLIEITKNMPKGYRVYDTKGIATTIASQAGGIGAKTGLYAIPLKYLNRNQKNLQGNYSFTVDRVNSGGVMKDMKIRRLTPLECERLQGFPDNWTKGFSDTQRYKMMGNAVTVNVVQYIVEKMFLC